MESKAREALYHLILSSMEQLVERDDFDAWVDGEIELAPLFKPVFESVSDQKATFIRELHQIFPAEVFDRFIEKHPEVGIRDRTALIVRIGKELQATKAIAQAL